MKKFTQEFHTLNYIIKNSTKILLVAHTRPDPDAVGSTLAFKYYLEQQRGVQADIACFSPFPDFLVKVLKEKFYHPDELDLTAYDAVIGCDSVDRGFDEIITHLRNNQVTVAIDHHPDIEAQTDVRIIDAERAATCEILYNFFVFAGGQITRPIATALLLGILGDTGSFKHSNTTARIMEIAADLVRHGAETNKIVDKAFSNKSFHTLKLWGKALEKARLNKNTGMIMTALTQQDLGGTPPSSEDIGSVASILSTVPGARFSLIVSQVEDNRIKGSLRAEKEGNVDVSAIAHTLGGGGHHLASGFELNGKILETANGWQIV